MNVGLCGVFACGSRFKCTCRVCSLLTSVLLAFDSRVYSVGGVAAADSIA